MGCTAVVQSKAYKANTLRSNWVHNLSLRESLTLGPPEELRRPGRDEAWAQRTPEMKAELMRWDLDFTKFTAEELVRPLTQLRSVESQSPAL